MDHRLFLYLCIGSLSLQATQKTDLQLLYTQLLNLSMQEQQKKYEALQQLRATAQSLAQQPQLTPPTETKPEPTVWESILEFIQSSFAEPEASLTEKEASLKETAILQRYNILYHMLQQLLKDSDPSKPAPAHIHDLQAHLQDRFKRCIEFRAQFIENSPQKTLLTSEQHNALSALEEKIWDRIYPIPKDLTKQEQLVQQPQLTPSADAKPQPTVWESITGFVRRPFAKPEASLTKKEASPKEEILQRYNVLYQMLQQLLKDSDPSKPTPAHIHNLQSHLQDRFKRCIEFRAQFIENSPQKALLTSEQHNALSALEEEIRGRIFDAKRSYEAGENR